MATLAQSHFVDAMKHRIILAFALNDTYTMSPAENMSCARVRFDNGENLTWRDAIDALLQKGDIEIRAWRHAEIQVPAIKTTMAARIPHQEASRLRQDMKVRQIPKPYPRLVIPAAYIADILRPIELAQFKFGAG